MEFTNVSYDLLSRCQRLSLRCHTQCLAAWASSPFVPLSAPPAAQQEACATREGVGRANGMMWADPGAMVTFSQL